MASHTQPVNYTPVPITYRSPSYLAKLGGWWTAVVLGFGVIIQCLAALYLEFLWSPTWRGSAFWRTILIKEWFLRSITITALVVRIASATQAVLCTSMLASLLLEHAQVASKNLCAVSILRFINAGPLDLIRYFTPRMVYRPEFILTAALLLTTLLLQFTSTVLLVDTGSGTLTDFEQQEVAEIGYSSLYTKTTYGSDFLLEKPLNYFLYAEYRPPTKHQPSATSNFSDSGPHQRAFLPFPSSANRTSIKHIKGEMFVADVRFVCVRPQITRFGMGFFTARDQPESALRISLASDVPSYSETEDPTLSEWKTGNITLECNLPTDNLENQDPNDRTSGMCGGSIGANTENNPDYSLMLFTITGTKQQWNNSLTNLGFPVNLTQQLQDLGWSDLWALENRTSNLKADGPWQSFDTGDDGVKFNFTLCYMGQKFGYFYTEAHAEGELVERSMSWSKSAARYDTEPVRRQLLNVPDGNRSPNFVINDPPVAQVQNKTDFMDWIEDAILPSFKTYAFCLNCTIGGSEGVNRAHSSLVQDMITSGISPARMCTTLVTIMLQMAYYDRMVEYTYTRDFYVTRILSRLQVPKRRYGQTAVFAVLGAHVLLVLVTLLLFLGWSKASKICAAWLAVAQIHKSPEFTEVLDAASLASDQMVEKALGKDGLRRVCLDVTTRGYQSEHEVRFRVVSKSGGRRSATASNSALHREYQGYDDIGEEK